MAGAAGNLKDLLKWPQLRQGLHDIHQAGITERGGMDISSVLGRRCRQVCSVVVKLETASVSVLENFGDVIGAHLRLTLHN